MKRVLYLSKANVVFSENDIALLAKSASENNRQKNITGYLCFSKDKFFQYFEGSQQAVDELLNTIRNDSRHTFINLIESDNNRERLFSSWSMKHLSDDDLSLIDLENYVANNLLYLKDNLADKARGLRILWNQIRLISLLHDADVPPDNAALVH